jgi:hypothetical protein
VTFGAEGRCLNHLSEPIFIKYFRHLAERSATPELWKTEVTKPERDKMPAALKKIAFAAAAVLSLGAFSTTADAHYYRHHHHGWHHGARVVVHSGYPSYARGRCVMKKSVRFTPHGRVVRTVRVCR